MAPLPVDPSGGRWPRLCQALVRAGRPRSRGAIIVRAETLLNYWNNGSAVPEFRLFNNLPCALASQQQRPLCR